MNDTNQPQPLTAEEILHFTILCSAKVGRLAVGEIALLQEYGQKLLAERGKMRRYLSKLLVVLGLHDDIDGVTLEWTRRIFDELNLDKEYMTDDPKLDRLIKPTEER